MGMAKVKIHGWLKTGGDCYLVVSTDVRVQIDWIPGVLPVGEIVGCSMTNAKPIKKLGSEAEAFIGAIPNSQLDVRLVEERTDYFLIEVMGIALGSFSWYAPVNWERHPSDSTWRKIKRADMPIFGDEPPSTRPRNVRPVHKSFYELRLEESRAKWREEDASAPSRRAFEFL